MQALAEKLKELIRARGPIPFRDWMFAALYDPEFGYYNRSDLQRWGREADYRTSPERSELFAATFARYFVKLYEELERPAELIIVEGGGGDGRFAQGVLRALAEEHPNVFKITRYHFDDTSADAQARARENLSEFLEHVTFANQSAISPSDPWLYFSNELLDAFPVHRLTAEGELYVTLDDSDKFVWTTGPISDSRLQEYSVQLAPGQIIEVNLAIDDWLAAVAAKMERGYVITVDYGAEAEELYDVSLRPAGTLRAFSRHGFVDDVLSAPGDYDITSSVNWTQVMATGERLGLQVVEFELQNRFLLRAGLLEALDKGLRQMKTDADKLRLTTRVREMILPGGMASSFQVLVQKRVQEG
ncbi:MAG TPA: SAM-dependent methyltransferase [Pyrinomonadaceae bacterium]|nr:SAM-dependent methyltransferase [Pyrinomonadaceae bacterium]